jgi:hypothetical protein
MSDHKQKYENSNARQSNLVSGTGHLVWHGGALVRLSGVGMRSPSSPPCRDGAAARHAGRSMDGAESRNGMVGPTMVWWAAHPAHAAASPGPAWSGPGAAQAEAQPQQASAPAQSAEKPSIFSSGLGIHNDALVKGLLIGAGVAYLLANETVQKNLMTAGVKLWSALQGGVEEMKERFRDAEAEAHASEKR